MANKTDGQALVYRVPDLDAPEEELLAFKERFFNYRATYRCRHMERMALDIFYYLGRQWLERDEDVLLDGVRGYIFKEQSGDGDVEYPRPVTNYIAPSIEVELASLGKRELTPNVITNSRDPRIEAAAKVGKDILNDRLKKLSWPGMRELVTFLTVVTGTGCLKSFWDETYTETTTIGSKEAVGCPQCGVKLSSPVVPKTALEQINVQHMETAQDVPMEEPDDEPSVMLQGCPDCGQEMQPYNVQPDEAQQGTDYFGRPLGQEVPKGNTAIEVVSPFDLFPENSGVSVNPDTARIWGQATVRDLDWLEERYPDYAGDIVREDPRELMAIHPILGEWSILGRYSSSMDSGIYENHCRLFEVYSDKSHRFPEGRAILIAGDKVIGNGTLYKSVTVQGVGTLTVPTVKYAAARFKDRHGEFWGQALTDDLVSPQNRLNGIDSQVIEARDRMGSPNLLVSEAMELAGPEWNQQYGGGKIMKYNTDPINPQGRPEVFGAVLMPAGVYEERDRIVQDMKQVAGPQDVEIGEAPRNISTTSGLQLLGESAERKRAPRERALIAMYEKIWEHQLRLVWTLRSEMDEYEVKNAEGDWELKQYDRMALQGQTKIEIEKQAFVNKSLSQSEGTREALADGLYMITNATARKRILELRNLPTDVNEDESRQVDIGKRQWVDFIDDGIVPSIDTSIDNFQIRFEVLGTFLLSDEGKRIEGQNQWPKILKLIAGWEEELAHAEMLDAQTVAFYGSRNMPPEQNAEMYATAMVGYGQAKTAADEANASAPEMIQDTGVAPPPVAAPMMPPPPVFLPAAKEERIYNVWMQLIQSHDQTGEMQQLLMQSGMPQDGSLQPQPSPIDTFLRFRAVVDAYKLLAQEQEMKAMLGMPGGPIAPGSPGSAPGAGPGGMPGQDSVQPNNPPHPPVAPGVGGQKKVA